MKFNEIGDKCDIDENFVPEELSLSVRKASIQSDDMEEVKQESPFKAYQQRDRIYSSGFMGMNPLNFVEDAGTEASLDVEMQSLVCSTTPKAKITN